MRNVFTFASDTTTIWIGKRCEWLGSYLRTYFSRECAVIRMLVLASSDSDRPIRIKLLHADRAPRVPYIELKDKFTETIFSERRKK